MSSASTGRAAALALTLLASLLISTGALSQIAPSTPPPAISCPGQTELHRELAQGNGTLSCRRKDGTMHGPYLEMQNGVVTEEGQFVEGERDGTWKTRYGNGQVASEGAYEDGVETGVWKAWWESGKLESEGRMKAGQSVGKWTYYYEDGRKSEVISFDDQGVEHGPFRQWYEDGTKAMEGEWQHGAQHGVWREFAEDGRPISQSSFDNGTPDGTWIEYAEPGKKTTQYTYRNGEMHGRSRTWAFDGTLVSDVTYVNGVEDGPFTDWFENGNKAAEGEYVAGMQHGPYRQWHETGGLMTEGEFANGNPTGNWTTWGPSGQKETEGAYVDGRQHGEWTYYEPSGAVREKLVFEHGYVLDVPFQCPADTVRKQEPGRNPPALWCALPNGVEKGPFVSWHSARIKRAHGSYQDGQKDGPWTTWHPNGNTEATGWWRMGREESKWQWFHANGKPSQSGSFLEGQKNGVWTTWDPAGNLTGEATYRRGTLHGARITIDPQGKRTEEVFEDGVLTSRTVVNAAGVKISEASLLEGARHGLYRAWTDSGELRLQGAYDHGKRTGEWVEIVGAKRSEGRYEDDFREGLWVTRAADGSRVERTFESGQIVDDVVTYDPDGDVVRKTPPPEVVHSSPYRPERLGLLGLMGVEYGRVASPDDIGGMANTIAARFETNGVFTPPGVSIGMLGALGGTTEGGFLYDVGIRLGVGAVVSDDSFLILTTGIGTDGVTGDHVPIAMSVPLELIVGFDIADTVHLAAFWSERWAFFSDARADGASLVIAGDELSAGLQFGVDERVLFHESVGMRLTYSELMGTRSLTVSVGLSGLLVD